MEGLDEIRSIRCEGGFSRGEKVKEWDGSWGKLSQNSCEGGIRMRRKRCAGGGLSKGEKFEEWDEALRTCDGGSRSQRARRLRSGKGLQEHMVGMGDGG